MTSFDRTGLMRAPRHLVFGAGQRAAIPAYAAQYGSRVLIVTDERLAADPLLATLRTGLEGAGLRVGLFDGVAAELPLSCIAAGVASGADLDADIVLGIGGGSCLDAAKVIALLLRHGGEPQDYYGEFKVPGPVLPLIAVPTTSGTGSEVTPVAVLDDPARAVKIGIASPHLIPEVAVCDPELTLTCPPGLTAVSGADALTHALEAFTTLRRPAEAGLTSDHVFIGKNDLSDMFALDAIRTIGANLEAACSDGADLELRARMMRGACLAGLAFGVAGTAAAHAIQYPVGASTHTPHGMGVATLMPYVMAWNLPACEAELAEVGAALGLGADGTLRARAEAAIRRVAGMFAAIGIPRTLADLSVGEAELETIAQGALGAERLVKNNPRPLDRDAMSRIVRGAFSGDLDGMIEESRNSMSREVTR